ncbi:MAG: sulfur carrier protein ThiS [Betaproteobacteria bacterium]|nr:sulfur carrier protein ThiS [Betaproteobacteria bacterium]
MPLSAPTVPAFRRLFYTVTVISLTVNGKHRQFDAPLNCADLLARLELAGKRVALERNGEIVPRSRFPEQMLADGDRLEIVVAVGGG